MRHSLTALFIAIAFATLSGCGQTGPLYMPTEEAPVPPAIPADSAAQQSKAS